MELGGRFELTVEAYVDETITDDVDATVIIGGIVGQCGGSGSISDVTALDGALDIYITNNCRGTLGAFYVGGIAGMSSGFLDGVILPNVVIDGSMSKGVTSYMGCVAGELSTGDKAAVTSCIVSGSVKAGESNPVGFITSVSYTGGLAGALMEVPVTGCRVAASVYGSETVGEQVIYATGGAFGRIRSATPVENVIAYGSALEGPAEWIGNFAGIVPGDESWEDTYGNKNIIVRPFDGIEHVGASISL